METSFYLPHPNSPAAKAIRKMPKRSKARLVLSQQTFEEEGALANQWLTDEIGDNLHGEIEDEIIPGRTRYVIERLKVVFQHYNEDIRITVSDYDCYLAKKHFDAYKIVCIVKSWINRGYSESHVMETMQAIDAEREQIHKYYNELDNLFNH